MCRADMATCSSDARAPAEGAPTRTARAQPITARMIGTAVNAARTKKIRWRKESGILSAIYGQSPGATIRHTESNAECGVRSAELKGLASKRLLAVRPRH